MSCTGKEKTGTGLLVLITAAPTVAFVASAVSGVEKGIQWLSNTYMVLALIFAVFVFAAGPTIIVLDLLPTSIAAYFGNLAQLAGRTEATGKGDVAEWLGNWTVFYWAWWISWTPFVGMFIARISRGRTIRQFIGGVILVPSAVSLVWFAIFGGTAIDLQQAGRLGNAVTQEAQLFGVLQEFPIPTALVMIGMCVALMRDLRQDPLIVRREFGVEAVESAVIEGHAKYVGDFEIRIGPGGSRVTTGLHEGHDPPPDTSAPAGPPGDG